MSPLAAVLLAIAPAASAAVLSFDAGPKDGVIYSADGYHVARLENDSREDHWVVDGKVRARGRSGALVAAGALSADGSKLLSLVPVTDDRGRSAGVAVALNGFRVGKPFAQIASLTLSPSGRYAAYLAKTPKGWAVMSTNGVGPALPDAPTNIMVTEDAVSYLVNWRGATWLYRDHKPVRALPSPEASVSPDLKRVGVVVRDRAAGSAFVEVDGARYGPYADATIPVFSRNSRHWGALAASPGSSPGNYDVLLADGKPAAGTECGSCSVVMDDAGRAFQDVLRVSVSDDAQIHAFYLDGRELREGGRPPKLGLLAGGAHYVYPMLTPRGVGIGFDGRVLEYDVPLPLPSAPVEFDGPREYHYWSFEGDSLRIVCGTTDGSDPRATRCAERSARVFKPVE
ncbi:MAG TPA: hypothetical protein VN915_09535 [Elusimicrobiota bacterium]|nr:hypothetical protein [Elusimicrobiota bacterium]